MRAVFGLIFVSLLGLAKEFALAFRMPSRGFMGVSDTILFAHSTSSQSIAKFSPIVENMALSKTVEIFGLTKELEKQGKEVFSLCVGEPDYQPPQEVLDGMVEAAKMGVTKYTAVNGDFSLRQSICQDLSQRKGTVYTPDQIVISNGAKQSVIQALMAVVSPGDSVLIPTPYWTSYPDMVKLCSASPVFVPTLAKDSYSLSPAALESAIQRNPKATALILCNPSNPTGCLMAKEELAVLGEVLLKYPQITIISDEIYERLVFNGVHTSFPAASPSLKERSIVVNGFSKSHAMTGFRLGYSASGSAAAKQMSKLQSQLTSCASSLAQHAIDSLLSNKDKTSRVERDWFPTVLNELKGKRDYVLGMLDSIPHVTTPYPKGAFYVFPNISYYLNKTYTTRNKEKLVLATAQELAMVLLRYEGVAMVPGEAFGEDKAVRLSYATDTKTLEEAMKRMKRFLEGLE